MSTDDDSPDDDSPEDGISQLLASSRDADWGQVSDRLEDSQTTNWRLFWFVVFSGMGAVPMARLQWQVHDAAFAWDHLLMSGVLGGMAVAIWSMTQAHPITPALVPGFVAAAGAYAVLNPYLSFRESVFLFEFAFPIAIGTIPGLFLYIVAVRKHHAMHDD